MTILCEKFKSNGFNRIRWESLKSRKIVAFLIEGQNLSMLGSKENIDFEKNSDSIIENNQDSKINIAFEYVLNEGFIQINTGEQKWFDFK
jgi:hypothetical protein